jgi:succinate dehydrogenase / fumarate reductase, membrane anchor subunit
VNHSGPMRTPLKNVRRLGSAKEGTDHFWRQRVTAVALLILTPIFVALVVGIVAIANANSSDMEFALIKSILRFPLVTILLALFIGAALVHMQLGMQTIIEDYAHGEGRKIFLLMLNTFFVIAVGVVAVYALLKLALVEF